MNTCQQCGKTHPRCNGHKASDPQQPCGRHPIKGGNVCPFHGGSAPQVVAKAAVRAEVMAWGLGDTDIDPGEVMLRLVSQSARRVDRYSRLLEEAYDAAERLREAQSAPQSDLLAEEAARLDLERVLNHGGVAALIGHTYAADKEGGIFATGEKIRGLAELEAQERDRLASFSAKAVAAGLAERQVRLAEKYGGQLAEVIVLFARLLGRDPTDPEVQRAAQTAISQITGIGPAVIEGTAA